LKIYFKIDVRSNNLGKIHSPTMQTHSVGPLDGSPGRSESFSWWMKHASIVLDNWDEITGKLFKMVQWYREIEKTIYQIK